MSTNSFFFGLISRYSKGKETILANFNMQHAQSAAWDFANEYHNNHNNHYNDTIKRRDTKIHSLADNISNSSSKWINLVIKL